MNRLGRQETEFSPMISISSPKVGHETCAIVRSRNETKISLIWCVYTV